MVSEISHQTPTMIATSAARWTKRSSRHARAGVLMWILSSSTVGILFFLAGRFGRAVLLRRCREIGAASTRNQRAFLIIDARFCGRILVAHAHDAGPGSKIAGHRGLVVVHAYVDRGHWAAELGRDGIIGRDIDDGSENSTMRIASVGIHHPLFAPRRLDLDSVFIAL